MSYVNPPIQEAVIDIKVAYPEEFDATQIDLAFEDLKESFPQKKVTNSIKIELDPTKGSQTNNSVIDGFVYQAADGKQVVQINRLGITFSLINHYSNWESFYESFDELWQKFSTRIKPVLIHRIGVRFINRVLIPIEMRQNLSDYFNVTSALGKIDDPIIETLLRTAISRDGNACIITEVMGPQLATDTKQGVILDIDAFREETFVAQDTGALKQRLESLRVLKNDIFEKSITDKLRKTFK